MRLIDADAFISFLQSASKSQRYKSVKIGKFLTVEDVLEAVISELDGTSLDGYKNAPTIEERKKGKWIKRDSYDRRDNFYACSECGRLINIICNAHLEDYPYCHCGADMRGEES